MPSYPRGDSVVSAKDIIAVTLSDTVDLTTPSRGIILAAEGAVKVTTVGGSTLTLPAGLLAPGIIHPLRLTRIWLTGTTADLGIHVVV